jgi:hypothetical protein
VSYPPYRDTAHPLDLMIRAKDAKKPIRLRVMKVNPAKSLYERLGFKVASEETDFIEMRAI